MMTLKPDRLRPGDVIGVLSPSSEIRAFPRRTRRALDALRAAGFVPKLSKNALRRTGGIAGLPEERAEDLRSLFEDDEVRAILCSTGGWSANAILPLVDYDLVRRKPKIVCGYSDITALLCALHARAGLCTFHGPTLLPSFGESGGPMPFTLECFRRVLCSTDAPFDLPRPALTTDELLLWDRDDTRPRALGPASRWTCLRPGIAEGSLVGGNLTTLGHLVGTEFFPLCEGAILLLEEAGSSPAQVEAALHHLEQARALRGVRGLVFGRRSHLIDNPEYSLHDVLASFGRRHDFPILAEVDFGHTEPRLTLPLGVRARLDATEGRISLLESAVA